MRCARTMDGWREGGGGREEEEEVVREGGREGDTRGEGGFEGGREGGGRERVHLHRESLQSLALRFSILLENQAWRRSSLSFGSSETFLAKMQPEVFVGTSHSSSTSGMSQHIRCTGAQGEREQEEAMGREVTRGDPPLRSL